MSESRRHRKPASARYGCTTEFSGLNISPINNEMVIIMPNTVTITREEYDLLKKKEEIADDVIFQLSRSLDDMKKGRIRKSP